ncbi:ATP synthase F1 subunit epsilon [Clostridium grantii]|uniref:ATP synthase epsilon chain n=1 Tax=Clostridium grantii DSM 8605 TaxID=1121316 RepID=A0A1M5TIX2_9CLOT|nr:ATP synthase F1 subunit epsilon [Clostridium grantii]SHH50611.1 F-type H+-transporting ATPase subunit epsilon [Clostridium grantii DSM 8605]
MDKLFELKIITPFSEFYFGKASSLNTETYKGRIGILKNRVPLIAELKPTITEFIQEDGKRIRFFSSEGILKVVNDKVYMYCTSCENKDDIDLKQAKESKLQAEEQLKNLKENENISLIKLALEKNIKRIELVEGKHE